MLKHILVPLDGSSLAECTLPHAVAFAKTFDAQVTLLRVMERPRDVRQLHPIDPLDWAMVCAEGQAYLDHLVAQLHTDNIDAIAFFCRAIPPSPSLTIKVSPASF